MRKRCSLLHAGKLVLLIAMLFTLKPITAKADEIKIMSYNVLTGFKSSDTFKQKYISWISKETPDIIAYQELTRFTEESFTTFAKSYGHNYTVFMPTGGCCPIGLSSKYPISNIQKIKENFHHAVIVAKVLDYNIVVLHLSPFNWEKRFEEINRIVEITKPIAEKENVLIMGDFNSLSSVDSKIYDTADRLKRAGKSKNLNNGAFDYTVIGQMQKAGFIDTFWETHKSFGYTCPTKYYGTSGVDNLIRIDYIWANASLKSKIKKSEVVYNSLTNYLSDHYPMLITLSR